VRAWDQPRVHIRAEKHVRASSDRAKDVMNELKIEIVPAGGGLRVVTHYPKRGDNGFFDWLVGDAVNVSVDYELEVPRAMNIEVENTNGAIEVTEVRGSHRIDTTNGRIVLARCAGDIDAETTNGGITAELLEVTPGKSVRLETTNGRIALTAPASLAARVDASTTNGSINTELPIAATEAHSHSLRGTLNGGGAELRLRTTNGSIDIRAAK